jgi:hypothetical protein
VSEGDLTAAAARLDEIAGKAPGKADAPAAVATAKNP